MAGFKVNTNTSAMKTYRSYAKTQSNLETNIERLSSGLRLNRAADDIAGMAIVTRLSGQVRGLNQAKRNTEQAINLIQTAESGLNEVHGVLAKMRELAVQAASDNISANDRAGIDLEFQQLKQEVGRIARTTEYNSMPLIDGSQRVDVTESIAEAENFNVESSAITGTYKLESDGTGNVTLTVGSQSQTVSAVAGVQSLNFDELSVQFDTVAAFDPTTFGATTFEVKPAITVQVGANGDADSSVGFSIGNSTATGLSINTSDILQVDDARSSIVALDKAIDLINDERSNLGAMQNRFEFSISNVVNMTQNVEASISTLQDTDFAMEAADLAKNQILAQSGTAMLAQANQISQGVLSLLKQ